MSPFASARNWPERFKSPRITSATSVSGGCVPPSNANGTTATGIAEALPLGISRVRLSAKTSPPTGISSRNPSQESNRVRMILVSIVEED
jgi:hypothetical protein